MRITVYSAILAGFLAVLLAYATVPAYAEMMSGPTQSQSGITSNHETKKPVQTNTDFSGEAKAGTAQQDKARQEHDMKARMKGKAETEAMPEKKMETFGGAKSGGTSKMQMRGNGKSEVLPEVTRGMPKPMKGEMRGKPEARTPDERMSARKVQGGEALVARVDRPDNCLRVRKGPGASYDIIGCMPEGNKLALNGVFSQDGRWAQLDNKGWVFYGQLQTDVKRPAGFASQGSFSRPAAAGQAAHRGHKRHIRYGEYYYGYPEYGYGYGGPYYYSYGSGYYGGCPLANLFGNFAGGFRLP